jgi:hypothetical protein
VLENSSKSDKNEEKNYLLHQRIDQLDDIDLNVQVVDAQ